MTEEQYQEILAKVKAGESLFSAVYPHGVESLLDYCKAQNKPRTEIDSLLGK
jgi:hypothetical protein